MKRLFLIVNLSAALAATAAPLPAATASVEQCVPRHREEHMLVSNAGVKDWRYLAFPALLDLGSEVLVSYKRARSHADDPGSGLEMIRINPRSGQASASKRIAHIDEKIMQMGEWVRFPDSTIANYIDAQQAVSGVDRIGLRVVFSKDGGKTFGPVERVGVIDGVEYGYAFDAVSEGRTTWMLVMTFSYLTGGHVVYPARRTAGSVDVIRSEDNGRTWKFVRSITKEFGNIPINESAFIRHEDGFLVSTRGYDNRQRLHRTKMNLEVIRQTDLTALHPFMTSHVGRPRLFTRDGRVYLLGRNRPESNSATPAPMQLTLFRLDPAALAVSAYAVLDNAERANVTDGYYAMPYFRDVGGQTRVNMVTYKALDREPPQIIRLEYLWDEIR
jgi:hypothetical protein